MEFMTGVKEKETLELSELLEEGRLGEEVKVNGAVHTIRDMGTVAFVILRKREGLVQCVYAFYYKNITQPTNQEFYK